jgi:hypothetical protein
MTMISFSRRNDHDYLVGWWVELAWGFPSISIEMDFGFRIFVLSVWHWKKNVLGLLFLTPLSSGTVVRSFNWSLVIAVGLFALVFFRWMLACDYWESVYSQQIDR